MCGICGFIERRSSDGAHAEALGPMLARIAHRGPDGEGRSVETSGEWTVALGHRRLSIIDLETGAQPMTTEGATITYNGELYNFRELRHDLEARGRVFRTKSDTEVLLSHVAEHGEAGLGALNGMFAFAVWDEARRRLVLARDRAGIKPLYYAELPGGGLAFASELASLMQHPGVSREPSQDGLLSYFFSDYVQAPFSMIAGAKKLQPGHFLVWQDGVLSEQKPFWTNRAPRSREPRITERDLADELWSRLGGAVERQLVADVPVGMFLSGGIDSSSVATLAAARSDKPMKAYAIAFDDPTFDESAHARTVANRIGVDYVQETLRERDLIDVLESALERLDEPLADPSYLPTYLLSRLAARDVKVVLSGDGGDELWGGYPTYQAHQYARLYRRIPRALREGMHTHVVDRLPIDERYQSLEWKLRRFTGRFDDDPVMRHLRWMSNVDLPDLATALPRAVGLAPETTRTRLPETSDTVHRILALDFATYMSGSVLTKVDRASMAHGLEVRPPLLDNEMIDFAFSVPSSFKLRRGTTKALFRTASAAHLPPEIVARPKKGFGIPLAAWLRGALRAPIGDIIESSPAWDSGLLERATFQRWNAEHQARRVDRSKPLWALLVLDRWLRGSRA
jgi:asparagine synthase (glutamine-hydrolysing)